MVAQPVGCAIVADMTDLTFGVAVRGSVSVDAFREVVRRADALGCDVIAAPDHLGAPEPFTTLAAAAGISPRMRLRTYVLNVGFWNPALLARAVATADLRSNGRPELGLGAGHMRSEHQDAGLPWLEPARACGSSRRPWLRSAVASQTTSTRRVRRTRASRSWWGR